MKYEMKYMQPKLYKRYADIENKDYEIKDKLKLNVYYDATIVPGIGVFDKKKNFIDGTDLHEGKIHDYNDEWIPSQEYEEAAFLGTFFYCWGHCITDNIKRLWVFLNDNYPQCKYLYSAYKDYSINKSFKSVLKYLIPHDIETEEINQIVKCKKLIIPEPSIVSKKDGIYYHELYKKTVEHLKSRALYNKSEFDSLRLKEIGNKIFFSRSKHKSHLEFGNEDLDLLFSKAGFSVIYPEDFSFEEQVTILSEAEVFASTEGSVSHNALFVNDNAKVIILKKNNVTNGYSVLIDNLLLCPPVYVDGEFSFLVEKGIEYQGPFLLVINEYVKQFFKDIYKISICSDDSIYKAMKYVSISTYSSKRKYKYNNEYDEIIKSKLGILGRPFVLLISFVVLFSYFTRKVVDKLKYIKNKCK